MTTYVGVAATPIDGFLPAAGTSANTNVTGISTSGTNRMLVYVEGNQQNRTQGTPPTVAGGAMTERYDTSATAAAANADRLVPRLDSRRTSPPTLQALSANGTWAAQVIASIRTRLRRPRRPSASPRTQTRRTHSS